MAVQDFAYEARTVAPGLTFHFYPCSTRNTNQLGIYWVGELDDSVTCRALLPDVLLRGSESCPTLRDVSRRLEYLYGSSFSGDVMKIGERHVITFRSSFVNDGYLPAGEAILDDTLDFVAESLYRPHLESGLFPGDVVEQEKDNLKRHIQGLFNDKRSYARERCIQEMCRDERFRLYPYGRVEDLPGITGDALIELWQESLARAHTHVYLTGDLSPDAMAKALERFASGRSGDPEPLRDPPAPRSVTSVREVEEALDVTQAKLTLGFRTGTRFGDPDLAALTIANGVLGQFTHSKLFMNVREAESLCYYAASSLDRTQGLLMISSGIEAAKRGRAQELILEQLENMKNGDISDEEMESTRLAYENRLRMLQDNPRGLMDIDLTWRLNGLEYDHEAYIEKLMNVTREEAVSAAQKIELDTVYFLHPTDSTNKEDA